MNTEVRGEKFFTFKKWWKNKKNNWSSNLQKFARGLMLPISILPFAGLLLGIGGAIGANTNTDAGLLAANIFKGMSEIIFANFAIMFCIAVTSTFTNDSGSAAFIAIISYLVFSSSQIPFIHFEGEKFKDIMWFHSDENLKSLITKNLGVTSLQTSIFGGIIIGGITAYFYNKFHLIKLPSAISFFSGVRFLPFIIIPISFLLAIGFLIFWPWIGQGINIIGENIAKAPGGVDGFLYGVFTRALMPFGLHQIVIAVAFTTPFGGILDTNIFLNAVKNAQVNTNTEQIQYILSLLSNRSIEGDQSIWNFINSLPYNSLPINNGLENIPIFEWFAKYANIYAGRFTQDYPTYLGVCMGIGAAFILTANKSNRKNTISVIGSAMLVAFLTGITEPLEFSFLFIAPYLYYLVYVPFSGLSYMLMQLVGAHIGVGFARGFIDLIIYGALPIMKGTKFYYAFIFAILEGALVFGIFYFSIKHWNLSTPGRDGNEIKLIKKDEFKLQKYENQRINNIIFALGGKENILSITSCATRLRVTVKEPTKINAELFKQEGASGTIIKGNNIQIIFGGEVVVLNDMIKKFLE
ncbi:PTS transporter subunit EIIC [Spiroplasma sp. SV19]|uniref:PTS transporter subunit EIIC n=1 Tax=Spiroplasma sp. SV19 TaxID=2570468 RepID=UPI0024B86F10|nr:PTS transporter subunit EIIC [Spiroplasma sp. SV19]WHQ37346.1 PTS glucose transporter subunit IIBC [Spiroplasma sp. SV19]